MTALADVKDVRSAASAQRLAWGVVRERILLGAYRGGTRLSSQRIAEELGISRMPVREALLQLQAEGLIEIRPNRAAVVTLLAPEEVLELFEIRAALEGLAIRLAAPALRGALAGRLRVARRSVDRPRSDPHVWQRQDAAFHDFLVGASGRARLVREWQRVCAAALVYVLLYTDRHGRAEMAGHAHRALLAAVEGGDDAALEATAREHVLATGTRVRDFLRTQGAWTV